MGFPDSIRVDRKTSELIADKFNECWLSQYSRPELCYHNKSREFTGPEFQTLLHDFGITDVPTTSHNPTANGICEQMHLSIGNSLQAQLTNYEP